MGVGKASHGILFLGWYNCSGSDKSNVWSDMETARQELETQAHEYHGQIKTIVVDCRCH